MSSSKRPVSTLPKDPRTSFGGVMLDVFLVHPEVWDDPAILSSGPILVTSYYLHGAWLCVNTDCVNFGPFQGERFVVERENPGPVRGDSIYGETKVCLKCSCPLFFSSMAVELLLISPRKLDELKRTKMLHLQGNAARIELPNRVLGSVLMPKR